MPVVQAALIYDMRGGELDEFGDPMVGWYWQMVDAEEKPTSLMVGPFLDYDDALISCQRALDHDEY
jgi:hypothetical protein